MASPLTSVPCGLAALGESSDATREPWRLTSVSTLYDKRVDDRDADAVQTAGDRVAAAAELSAGVKDRHDDLDRGLALGGVHVDRDAAAVVGGAHAAVGHERHGDGVAMAGERLVDGVVDHLVDEVVQTPLARRADVHAGTLAYGLETLENRDVACAVCQTRSPRRVVAWPQIAFPSPSRGPVRLASYLGPFYAL